MKIPLLLSLSLAALPAMAQAPVTSVAPLPTTQTATQLAPVTPFITGLKEPQGMTFDAAPNFSILVCDYGAGEILRFDLDGKLLGKVATGLKGPSQLVVGTVPTNVPNSFNPVIYVSERKANRVIAIDREGKITQKGDDIAEPLGLAISTTGLMVVSHTTSKIYRWEDWPEGYQKPDHWEPVYSAPSTDGARYGFRWLTGDGEGLFLSDEVGERILMLTGGGKIATFATGISDPSGIAISPDNQVYVANEGDGGQLIRLNSEGEKTVVAEKLGRPRGILFLNEKTVFVSNRDGNVWKVALP